MTQYDRTVEDLGNIVSLEHVNTRIPDQQLATLFYASGLGLTRDPYLMTGVTNMWINVGRSQFHLPSGKAEVLRGHTGLVMPNREALVRRLAAVKKPLEGTRFSFKEHNEFVEATCPWGNRIRCFEPRRALRPHDARHALRGAQRPRGTTGGIARFYREIMRTPADVGEDEDGRFARASVGPGQQLIFRETDEAPPAYDGHHIAVYLADFSGPYRRLLERGLSARKATSTSIASWTSSISTAARCCSRSSTRCAACAIRSTRGRRSIAIPSRATALFAPGHEQVSWSLPLDA